MPNLKSFDDKKIRIFLELSPDKYTGEETQNYKNVIDILRKKEYPTHIKISGDIKNSTVFCSGDIICEGNVENSMLCSLNNVILKKEVINSSINANEDIRVNEIVSSNLKTQKNIFVENRMESSVLRAGLDINAENAVVFSSILSAKASISIRRTAKSSTESEPVKIYADNPRYIKEKISSKIELVDLLEDAFNKTKEKIEEHIKKQIFLGRIGKPDEVLDSMKFKQAELEKRIETLQADIKKLEGIDDRSRYDKYVLVKEVIEEGTIINLYTLKHICPKDNISVKYILHNQSIEVISM